MILDIDAFFADGSPIILSDTVELAEGQNKQLDSQLLGNFFDTPMVIDEIRVQIQTPDLELQVANFGGSIRLKMALGPYALSTTYIPVGCLAPAYDGGSVGYATLQPARFSPESLESGFTESFSTGFFRWKLPRPLVCPVGMPLDAKISRQIENLSAIYPDADPLTVNVAYVGRVTKKSLPTGIIAPVPYVGLFEKVFTSASVATSGQLDLYNPFKVPLNVQRLIGRWQNIYLDASVPLDSWIGLNNSETSGGTLINMPVTQIRTFDGFYITNGFIPGEAVFENGTRSFVINSAFESGQGLEVMLDTTAGLPSTGAQPSPTGSNTALITMVGWRNEQIS